MIESIKFHHPIIKVVTSKDPWEALLMGSIKKIEHTIFVDLNLTTLTNGWRDKHFENVSFLGCQLKQEDHQSLLAKGVLVFPRLPGIPYDAFRHRLYHWEELLSGHDGPEDHSLDLKIYRHFQSQRFKENLFEAMAQRLHDHSMDHGIRQLMGYDEHGMTGLKAVGFMGGHGVLRTDSFYHKSAYTAKKLTEAGFFIVTGGGPGIMEAANLGAWLAGYPDSAVQDAFETMRIAPGYRNDGYIKTAIKVIEKYPNGKPSLAIPTWFYGHEPSNVFATRIAKYFSNSIREDTLLAIALYGIVYAPGSAGTTQEIFMDAAQNHYATYGYCSPMVFMGKKRYEIDTLLFPVLKQLSFGKAYHELLHLSDDPDDVVRFIINHPPVKA